MTTAIKPVQGELLTTPAQLAEIDQTTITSVNDNIGDKSCTAIATDSTGRALFICSGSAWHKFGTRTDGDFSLDWLKTSFPELFRKIVHRDLIADVGGQSVIIPGIQAVIQIEPSGAETFLEATSVTSSRAIVQPGDLLELFEAVYKQANAKLTSVGYLHDGAHFFASAKLAEGFNVLGDEHETFLNIWDAYDGSHSVRFYGSNHRAVCQNTVNSSWNGSKSKFLGAKHSKNMLEKLPQIMAGVEQHIEATKKHVGILEQMAKTKIEPVKFFDTVLDAVYADSRPSPIPVNVRSVDMGLNLTDLAKSRLDGDDENDILSIASEVKKIAKQKKKRSAIIHGDSSQKGWETGLMDRYESKTCETARGSVYAAYQAVTELANHGLQSRTRKGKNVGSAKMAALMPGGKSDILSDIAYDCAMELVG